MDIFQENRKKFLDTKESKKKNFFLMHTVKDNGKHSSVTVLLHLESL